MYAVLTNGVEETPVNEASQECEKVEDGSTAEATTTSATTTSSVSDVTPEPEVKEEVSQIQSLFKSSLTPYTLSRWKSLQLPQKLLNLLQKSQPPPISPSQNQLFFCPKNRGQSWPRQVQRKVLVHPADHQHL